jgi:DNA topoisomerase IA
LKRFWCCSILKCNLSHIVCTVNIIRTKVTFAAGGEKFSASGRTVNSAGFTAVMPWLAVADESLPPFSAGEYIPMTDVELYQVNVFLKLVF